MPDFSSCKLEIFLPESHLEALRAALQSVDAGHLGTYDSCLSYSRVTSCDISLRRSCWGPGLASAAG